VILNLSGEEAALLRGLLYHSQPFYRKERKPKMHGLIETLLKKLGADP
jgi:hypothetical protein